MLWTDFFAELSSVAFQFTKSQEDINIFCGASDETGKFAVRVGHPVTMIIVFLFGKPKTVKLDQPVDELQCKFDIQGITDKYASYSSREEIRSDCEILIANLVKRFQNGTK